MDSADVELLERTSPFRGFFRMDVYRLRHRLFGGGWSGIVQREVFVRGRAVAVVLYDPDREAVVLVEQFRIAPYALGRTPWMIELVAGVVEEGEDPAAVARREAQEEAGVEILDLFPLHEYFVSPGGTTETVIIYCARVDSRSVGGVHGLPHEQEDIRAFVRPLDDALADLTAGRIDNAITLIGLQHLALHRAALKARWGRPLPPP